MNFILSSLLRPCLLASCALALTAAPASAQIGGWVKKKVTDRVADRAADKIDRAIDQVAPGTGPGEAFTSAEQMDGVLRSLEMAAAARARSDSLNKLPQALHQRVSELEKAHGGEIDAHRAAKIKQSQCRGDFVKSKDKGVNAKNDAAVQKIAEWARNDPARAREFGQEGARMQREVHEAVQRGDQAGADRAQAAFFKKFGLDVTPVASEADLARACGGPPTVPPALAEIDSLRDRLSALEEQRRALEKEAQEGARTASGLPQQQYFVMSERIERWYAIAVKGERGGKFWTEAENAMFEARRARIERVFGKKG